jgi:spore germination cell wall hydrolase CwlJ-like protein
VIVDRLIFADKCPYSTINRGVSMNKMFLLLALCMSALAATGCTTSSSTLEAPTTSMAPTQAAISPPIPNIKPDSIEAKSSLAASVESDVEPDLQAPATTVAFAPTTETSTKVPPILAEPKAIPQEAIIVANAKPVNEAPVQRTSRDRECMMRVMYFESNRSSQDGQLAVGTVVMHRLAAGKWGNTVCSVVTARNQFAPGVMSRRMQGDTSDLATLADAIIAGKRHPSVGKHVLFFHTAGLKFRYTNMRYVINAGGNSFYYKASRRRT